MVPIALCSAVFISAAGYDDSQVLQGPESVR